MRKWKDLWRTNAIEIKKNGRNWEKLGWQATVIDRHPKLLLLEAARERRRTLWHVREAALAAKASRNIPKWRSGTEQPSSAAFLAKHRREESEVSRQRAELLHWSTKRLSTKLFHRRSPHQAVPAAEGVKLEAHWLGAKCCHEYAPQDMWRLPKAET